MIRTIALLSCIALAGCAGECVGNSCTAAGPVTARIGPAEAWPESMAIPKSAPGLAPRGPAPGITPRPIPGLAVAVETASGT